MSWMSLFSMASVSEGSPVSASSPLREGEVAEGPCISVEEIHSKTGVKAWFVRATELPLITVHFAFRGGGTQDPVGKEGLGFLLSATLDEGAGSLEARAFQDAVGSEAIQLSFHLDEDYLYGDLKMLTTAKERAVELMALALQQPRFDSEAIDRARAQIVSLLRHQAMDPEEIARKAWRAHAFSGHPYGRPLEGTPETLASLTAEDLRIQHRKLVARDDIKVVLVGDLTREEAEEMVDRLFSGIPEKATLTPVAEITQIPSGSFFVPFETPQNVIRFGYHGLKRDDPNFISALVMNHILGGGVFSSWLYQDVREKHGLAYGVWTTLLPLTHTGILVGGAATRTDHATQTLNLIYENLARMVSEGPDAETLSRAQDYLTGSYILGFDSARKIAKHLLALQLYGLPSDYIQKRNALIRAVTLDDIRAVAKRLLKEMQPLIVTVGQMPKTMLEAK